MPAGKERKCRSRCGNGIRIPAPIRASWTAVVTSLAMVSQLSKSEVQHRSSKSSELSPNPKNKTYDSGFSMMPSAFCATSRSRAFTCCGLVPYATPTGISMRRSRSDRVQLVTHLGPTEGPNYTGAKADAFHRSLEWLDLHGVADQDRALEHQDETRDEVGHDVLQSESNAHPEGACQERELTQVEPRRGHCEHETHEQDHVPGHL